MPCRLSHALLLVPALACGPGDPGPTDGSGDDPPADTGPVDTLALGDPHDTGPSDDTDSLDLHGRRPAEPVPLLDPFTATAHTGATRGPIDLRGQATVLWFFPAAATSG